MRKARALWVALVLLCTLFAEGCTRPAAVSTERVIGGDRGASAEARFMETLDRIRKDPDARPKVLKSWRGRLEQRKDQRIEERLEHVNKILDRMLDMDEEEYQRQRAHLAKNLRRALSGGVSAKGEGGGGGRRRGGERGEEQGEER